MAYLAWSAFASLSACTPQGDPMLEHAGYREEFNEKELSADWYNTGGPYRIVNGELFVQGARNRPLWLRRRLPDNFRIAFIARSESPHGDIKVEVCGDGVSKAESEAYTASGYVIVFGGWQNSLNIIARKNEHGSDRAEGPMLPVQMGHRYRMRIERRGSKLSAWADDRLLVHMVDGDPLGGLRQDHFAFNNWASPVYFDKLSIQQLP